MGNNRWQCGKGKGSKTASELFAYILQFIERSVIFGRNSGQ